MNNSRRNSPFHEIVLPVLLLAGIWSFDEFFFKRAQMTPLLSIVSLAILAFWLRPRIMLFWSVIFFCLVALRLFQGSPAFPVVKGDPTPWLRLASFSVGASVAIALCLYRFKVEGQVKETFNILAKLPTPVLISNENGTITFSNERAAALLGMSTEELRGHSYFSLLIHPDSQGRTIARYIEIMDSPVAKDFSMPLKIRWRDDLKVTGVLARATFYRTKALITVLEVESKVPRQGSS